MIVLILLRTIFHLIQIKRKNEYITFDNFCHCNTIHSVPGQITVFIDALNYFEMVHSTATPLHIENSFLNIKYGTLEILGIMGTPQYSISFEYNIQSLFESNQMGNKSTCFANVQSIGKFDVTFKSYIWKERAR